MIKYILYEQRKKNTFMEKKACFYWTFSPLNVASIKIKKKKEMKPTNKNYIIQLSTWNTCDVPIVLNRQILLPKKSYETLILSWSTKKMNKKDLWKVRYDSIWNRRVFMKWFKNTIRNFVNQQSNYEKNKKKNKVNIMNGREL